MAAADGNWLQYERASPAFMAGEEKMTLSQISTSCFRLESAVCRIERERIFLKEPFMRLYRCCKCIISSISLYGNCLKLLSVHAYQVSTGQENCICHSLSPWIPRILRRHLGVEPFLLPVIFSKTQCQSAVCWRHKHCILQSLFKLGLWDGQVLWLPCQSSYWFQRAGRHCLWLWSLMDNLKLIVIDDELGSDSETCPRTDDIFGWLCYANTSEKGSLFVMVLLLKQSSNFVMMPKRPIIGLIIYWEISTEYF